jgi:hypothetical protein
MTTMARKYRGGRCSEGRVSPGLLKRSEYNGELWKVKLKMGAPGGDFIPFTVSS